MVCTRALYTVATGVGGNVGGSFRLARGILPSGHHLIMAGYSMGLAAGTNIPIEHLDYDYVGKCNKASEVEKILRVLR